MYVDVEYLMYISKSNCYVFVGFGFLRCRRLNVCWCSFVDAYLKTKSSKFVGFAFLKVQKIKYMLMFIC